MRLELAAMGWIVSVNDARLPGAHPKTVRQLFDRRNSALNEEVEAIDEHILTILLGAKNNNSTVINRESVQLWPIDQRPECGE